MSTLLVACHPDDEALWFSGVAAEADRIVLVYLDSPAEPGLGAGRRRALAEHPDRDRLTVLGLPEPGLFGAAAGLAEEGGVAGLAFPDPAKAALAARSLDVLTRVLGPIVSGGGRIHTHGPWGEYGHEEHVLVHHAVRAAAEGTDAEIWCPLYAGPRSLPWAAHLRSGFDGAEQERRSCDLVWLRRLRDLYRRHDCWTWGEDCQEAPEEVHARLPL